MNNPSAGPVTIVPIRVHMPQLLWQLFEDGEKYGIIIPMVFVRLLVAAAATVYQEPHF